MYDKKILQNKAFSESAITFTKWRPLRLNQTRSVKMGPPDPMSGYPVPMDEFLENGDLMLRFYAPYAKEMYVVVGHYNRTAQIPMKKREDGVWEGVFPYNPEFAGYRKIAFYVDGMQTVNTKMPITPGGHSFGNFIEFPDPDMPYILINDDVPHGSVCREIYYSTALNEWMRCMVYLPAAYHEGGEYPVLYLQDGALGNELVWMYATKVPNIMDNMIAKGMCEPFIVVTNESMMQLPYEMEAVDNFDGFEQTLINDCIPFIDKRFRTKADKWHRAMAGFSLGSMQTSCIGISHPETFAWLGILSGYMRRRDSHPLYEQNPYLYKLSEDYLNENYKLFYRCMGTLDGNFPEFLEDDEFCRERGADKAACYRRKTYENHIHDITVQRYEFVDFAGLLFRS
ncbi:MAG: alpha/beta hydrolase-fold protein [Lachnospiraceae bacterium]